jgi:hypothetical protein
VECQAVWCGGFRLELGTRIPDHNLKEEEWVAGHFFKCSSDLFCRLYGGALKMFTDVTYMPL